MSRFIVLALSIFAAQAAMAGIVEFRYKTFNLECAVKGGTVEKKFFLEKGAVGFVTKSEISLFGAVEFARKAAENAAPATTITAGDSYQMTIDGQSFQLEPGASSEAGSLIYLINKACL